MGHPRGDRGDPQERRHPGRDDDLRHLHDASRTAFLWPLVLLAVGILAFAPGLEGARYADDFLFVRGHEAPPVVESLVRADRGTAWYRPLQALVLAGLQAAFGWETWPIHVLALVAHVALATLVAAAVVRLTGDRPAAAAASLAMVASQAAAPAVVGNDTLSQVLAVLFAALAVWLAWTARLSGARWLGVAAFALALLSKESSFGALLAVAIVVTLCERRGIRAAVGVAPYAAVAVLYLLARAAAGARPAELGEGRYEFAFDATVLGNVGLVLGAALSPTSTVAAMDAWRRGAETLTLAALALPGIVALALVFLGLRAWGRPWAALALVALALASLVPVVFLNQVSELHAYSALPYVAMLLGIAVGRLLRQARAPALAGVVALVTISLLGLNVAGARAKAALMACQGERAELLLERVASAAAAAPRGGTVLLAQPPPSGREYSIYHLDGFHVLRYAENVVRLRAGRPDVHVRIVPEAAVAPGPRTVVVRYPRDADVPCARSDGTTTRARGGSSARGSP